MSDQIKIVHIGLGAFFKAHIAWYTQHTSNWKIAAFTGRSPKAAEELAANNFKYQLVTKSAEGDQVEEIDAVVAAYDGNDIAMLKKLISNPAVSIVTLTITEAGYNIGSDGALNRLLTALECRFKNNGGAITLVPCDNLIQNGAKLRAILQELSSLKSPQFIDYLKNQVSIVSTSVDRITPKSEIKNVVITEPYSAWVLQGDFPAGRPNWDSVGAKFVRDIKPFENRKLWLLNGAHSLIAYAGLNRGFETVHQAINDAGINNKVREFWREASSLFEGDSVELDLDSYQTALIKRFSNPAIEHKLAQIAMDGSNKLKERIVPIIKRKAAKGDSAPGCEYVLAEWIEFLNNQNFVDANQNLVSAALAEIEQTKALINLLDGGLAADRQFVESINRLLANRKKNHVKTTS